jgi:tetratricopeptide (TPR) repeat protein
LKELRNGLAEDAPDWQSAQLDAAQAELVPAVGERSELLLRAIENMQENFPEEVRRLDLRARLAEALREGGQGLRALELAREAVREDPLGQPERVVLGNAYEALRDNDAALANWESALRLSASRVGDEAIIHEGMGSTLFRQARDCADPARRRTLIEKAIEHTEHALLLASVVLDPLGQIPDSAALSRAEGHVRLGIYHAVVDRQDRSVAHLRTAVALMPQDTTAVRLLAQVLVRSRNPAEAEQELRAAVARVGDSSDAKELADTVGVAGEERPRGLALAQLKVDIGFSLAARRIDSAGVRDLCKQARAAIESVEVSAATRNELEAQLAVAEGWAAMNEGGTELGVARARLEHAVTLNSEAESYALLGLAYARSAREEPSRARARRWSELAATCARQARDLDFWGDAKDLLAEFDASEGILTSAEGNGAHPASNRLPVAARAGS